MSSFLRRWARFVLIDRYRRFWSWYYFVFLYCMGKNWYFDHFCYVVCICGFGFRLRTLLEPVISRFVSLYAAFAKYVAFLEEINVYTVWSEDLKKHSFWNWDWDGVIEIKTSFKMWGETLWTGFMWPMVDISGWPQWKG